VLAIHAELNQQAELNQYGCIGSTWATRSGTGCGRAWWATRWPTGSTSTTSATGLGRGAGQRGTFRVGARRRAGAPRPIESLESANRDPLAAILAELEGIAWDWVAYHRDSLEFRRRKAVAWTNQALGQDLMTSQIDPDFLPGMRLGRA
jgi:hypothetical protein